MDYDEMYRLWNDAVTELDRGRGSVVVSSLEGILKFLLGELAGCPADARKKEKTRELLTRAFAHLGTALYQRWKRYGPQDSWAREALASALENYEQALSLDPNCAEAKIGARTIRNEALREL